MRSCVPEQRGTPWVAMIGEMKRAKTSKAWMHEHVSDPYVRQARVQGYRSRAAFKLLEIDRLDKLFRPGMTVVDLGAAPGSWSQVTAERVGGKGKVVAVDVLPMAPVPGVTFIQGDFTDADTGAKLRLALEGRPVDLVICDMAPNISGISVSDQARCIALAEAARDFALSALQPDGVFLVKVFHGAGFTELLQSLRAGFARVMTRKPKASRDRSSELYLLCRQSIKP
jgi:23S rRNA (uridine2552-2'-O)-methyltransferase